MPGGAAVMHVMPWNEAVGVFATILAREFFLLWRALANFEGFDQGRMSSNQQSNCQTNHQLHSNIYR
jgi:hypothetical protein